jgi:regulator of protease activity HflC (stomatin/prohibitin superfamily)
MYWIFMSLAAIVILFVLLGMGKGGFKVRKRQILCLLGAVFVVGGMYTTVPTGHTGILTTFGRVENTTLEAGLHMKSPFQEVIAMDNRTQKQTLELLCFSSDIQEVSISYSINYQIQKANAQTIYKTIGKDYYHVVMEPRIQDAVKSVMAKYTAESLIEHREKLSASITEILVQELSVYNIEVINTAIENMDFSDAFTQAVEEKQVAQQQLLKAQTEQAQRTMEQEAEAERQQIAASAEAAIAVIGAEADKEVLRIQADAAEYAGQKDAAVNEALAKSLTDTLLEYYEIKQWDGKLPEYYVAGVDSVSPILGSVQTNTEAAE